MNPKFSLDLKNPMGRKLWAIGGCIGALVFAQLSSPTSANASLGLAPFKMLAVLGCFAALAWWLLKKLPNAGATQLEPALKVVSKTALSPKNGLALVEAEGIRVLVAYGDGFARVLPLDPVGAHKENAS